MRSPFGCVVLSPHPLFVVVVLTTSFLFQGERAIIPDCAGFRHCHRSSYLGLLCGATGALYGCPEYLLQHLSHVLSPV